MQTRPFGPTFLLTLAPVLVLFGGLPARAADERPTLERALVQQAPRLIKFCKSKGYGNVGVLKFLVSKDASSTMSDNVGTLNMLAARRLELALLLANDPKSPVGILRNPSAVAARTRGANHSEPAGRRRLFAADYPLAWGKKVVKPDAFVTGNVRISKDLQTMTVSLLTFDKDGDKLEPFGADFLVRNDAGKLGEMSQSFVLRAVGGDEQVVEAAAKVQQEDVKHPLAGGNLPVSLQVLYDGKPVPLEFHDGKAFVPEPGEGQKVALRLRRDDGKERYGVVLKVNGENTIARERLPDLQCRRWILSPGSRPITITGYQMDEETAKQFRVLSPAKSKERAINYGADVGTISLTVFRESKTPEMYDAEEERLARNARIVSRVRLPAEAPANYNLLKQQLLNEGQEGGETRGLVEEGERVASKVKTVAFHPDPTPLMSVTIVYHRPER